MSDAKLMMPLFCNGMFNCGGRRIRAVHLYDVSDGEHRYRLWTKAGTPDIDYRKIDGKCRFLISTPKTASSIRFIPMCSEVLAELAGLIAILDTLYDTPSPTIDGYTDFIFRNRYGDLLNPHSLNRAIERIIRDYNAEELKLAEEDQRSPLLLPHFSVHSLRHTFCTRMFEVESNHKAIQTIMGHAEISTTLDIYTHITEDTLKNSVQNMSAKIKLFG